MRNVLRGIVIIFGIILIFILITACTPNRSIVRNEGVEYSKQNFGEENGLSRYDYEYEEEALDELNTDKRISRDKKRSAERIGRRDKRSIDEEIGEDYTDKYNKNEKEDTPSRDRFYQIGNASWYGREFHGKMTASGERFNMNKLTAAHRMLPFGTDILVRNFDNKRVVKVTINDRGPYKEGLILDVSYAAARRLGMLANGEAEVGIKILRSRKVNEFSDRGLPDDEVEPVVGSSKREEGYHDKNRYLNESTSSRFSIQAGAFYSRRYAESLKRQLETLFDNPVILLHDDDMYKVRIEGINSRGEARRYKGLLEVEGIPSFVHQNKE